MEIGIMSEQQLMDWLLEVFHHDDESVVSRRVFEKLFKGMMLVPTKESLLPRAKAIYPVMYGARIVPENVLILSQITTEPMHSSAVTNSILLDFIRQHEPDYPDMHTRKK